MTLGALINSVGTARSRAQGAYWRLKSRLVYRFVLGSLGARSKIIRPLQLRNLQNVHIGADVLIHPQAWIMTLSLPDSSSPPRLTIGDGCVFGHFNHITCVNRVDIGAKVLTADRVHISDNIHRYEDIAVPIMDQPVASKGPVEIGAGTWLGENVSVLSCRIGRNCVIGANAVVVSDIPDFCVAAGVPARVIRRFDPAEQKWTKF